MTSRRQFLVASALGAAAPRALAQRRRATLGMLLPRPLPASEYAAGILGRLSELGYRDGAGMSFHYRSADGVAERFPALAEELVALKCELIFALGPLGPAVALRRAPVPVVFVAVDYDPVSKRLVASLRRPGGNLTGVYVQQEALVAKRFELMRELVPDAGRFLVLADVFSAEQLPAARSAAKQAGVALSVIQFSKRPYDYSAAFDEGRKAGIEALVGLASPVFSEDSVAIAGHLKKHRLPAVGSSIELARNGYLLSFGADAAKVGRRAAEIALRILEGARPSSLPVELASEFELAVNASSARVLGRRVPESVLARATTILQ